MAAILRQSVQLHTNVSISLDLRLSRGRSQRIGEGVMSREMKIGEL
jgi:hypothetical protein